MSEEAINDTIQAEIGEAIKSMEAAEAIEPQVEPGTTPEPTTEQPKEDTPAASEAFVADDALIKRGVLAGLDVEDVKAFKSAEQAERILAKLEAAAEPKTETKTASEDDGAGFPAEDFEKAVKEITDAKDEDGNPEYDPKIVKLLSAMSGLLKSQGEQIAALKKAGASAEAQTTFDKAFDGLDKEVKSHVDAATKSKLKAKFDFLKAAHKSAKDKATDGEVFEEASKIVLGDLISKAGTEARAAAAAKRGSLALARPGGESGQNGTQKPMTEEDIASALFEQLTK